MPMVSYEVWRRLMGTPKEGDTIQVIVDTTPVQVGSEGNIRAVTLKADHANSDTIWVGFSSSVDNTTGFPLEAGDHIDIVIDSLAKIYVVAGSSGQKLYAIWVR